MSTYVAVNWLLFLLTLYILAIGILKHRFLLIKPSVIVVVFFIITIQMAATLNASWIELYLPEPYQFLLLIHGFPLLGLLGGFILYRRTASTIFNKIVQSDFIPSKKVVVMLWAITFFIIFLYFINVPIKSTGIYAVIFDPFNSAQAREESLKLLNNAFIRYSYLFFISVVAPLLSIIITYQFINHKNMRYLLTYIIQLALLIVLVSISGARGPAASLILVIILAVFLKHGFNVKLHWIVLGIILVLMFPAIFSILREGRELSLLLVYNYMKGSMVNRAFYIPMEVGLYHVHYAQTQGLSYIAAIPKLANIFGIDPINLSNIIYLKYSGYTLSSGFANTSYVFSYYAMFGIASWPVSVLLLWSLDISLVMLNRLNINVLLPVVTCMMLISKAFTASDFTTTLITHGFIFLIVIALFLNWYQKTRFIISGTRRKEQREQNLSYDIRPFDGC